MSVGTRQRRRRSARRISTRGDPSSAYLLIDYRSPFVQSAASAESRSSLVPNPGSAFLVSYSTLALTASRARCRCKPHSCSQTWPTSSKAPRRRRAAPAKCGRRRRSKYAQPATSSRRRRPRRRPKTRGISIMMKTATAVCASARRGSSAGRREEGGPCTGSLDQIGVVCYVRIL